MRQRNVWLSRFAIFAAFLSCLIFAWSSLAATDTSPWLTARDPEFTTAKSVLTDEEYPTTYVQRGNVDCDNLTFTHRTGDPIPFLPLHQESSVSGCYISTSSGELDPNGYLHVNGSAYAADIVKSDNSPTGFFAFPNSDTFISNASNSPASGAYVWLGSLRSALRLEKDNFGRMRAKLQPDTPQTPLKDAAGNSIAVMADNFGVSENGQWAVVDAPGRALIRINLITLEVLPFAPSLEYGNGIGAALRTHISGDGRFAVVASKSYNLFKLYDLSTCTAAPAVLTASVNCNSRDMYSFLKSHIPGFTGVLQMRFQTGNLIKIYASRIENNVSTIGQYMLAAPGTPTAGMDYLALGDSFSSGEGAHNYEVGTDEHNFNMCHLSVNSYPYVIARKLQLSTFHSVACSGATSYNVIGGGGVSDSTSDTKRDNQYSQRPSNDSLKYWLPGYAKQVEFVSENQPSLVTLSVIGNDLGFDDLIKKCIAPKTCYPTHEDRIEEFKRVDAKLTTLTSLYKKLKKATPVNARIYAIGYPQIAKPGGSCGLNVHLDSDELVFASELITRINQVVKTAASKAGILYGDIESALDGYRLCEATLGNHAVNGLTAGDDILHIIGNESYHPTAFGQYLMAQKLLGETNNFSTSSTVSATLPVLNDNNPALVNAPKTGRTINKKDTLTTDKSVVKKGGKVTTKISNLHYGLPANTPLQIQIDGTPSGTVTTSPTGETEVTIPLPDTLPEGIHEIDITGPDVSGTPVDISTPILVTPEQTSMCGSAVPASGIDSDTDGTDDACDPDIGPAVTQPAAGPGNSSTSGQSGLTSPTTSPAAPTSSDPGGQTTFAAYSLTPSNRVIHNLSASSVLDPEVLEESPNIIEAHSPAARVALRGKEVFTSQYKHRPVLVIFIMLIAAAGIIYLLIRYRPKLADPDIYAVPTRHYFRF